MRKLLIIFVCLLPLLAWASHEESVESLKARAERSHPKDQVDLFTKIAERQMDVLDKAYNEGNLQQARAALTDVVTYGTHAAETSAETGKHMKKTEIALRKIAARLDGVRKNVELDERPPVSDAIQKLESARTELLNRMFRK